MELRAWVKRLMGLGPEWRIKRVDSTPSAMPPTSDLFPFP